MIDITIDSIIRKQLSMMGLPIHYYVPMLVIARRGLEEMHFDTLQKVKYALLTIDAANEALLPADYVELVYAGIEHGDKVRNIGQNDDMNARDNGGVAFPQTENQYRYSLGLPGVDTFLFDEYGQFKAGQFGRNVTWDESFKINREEGFVRVDNKSNITQLHLVYIGMPEKISNKSVIHPFAQQALMDYINWKWAEYTVNRNQYSTWREPDYLIKRREFYNQYRILRGRKNKMTTVEIKRAIRRNIKLSVKN